MNERKTMNEQLTKTIIEILDKILEEQVYLASGNINYYDPLKHDNVSDKMVECWIIPIDSIFKIVGKYLETEK